MNGRLRSRELVTLSLMERSRQVQAEMRLLSSSPSRRDQLHRLRRLLRIRPRDLRARLPLPERRQPSLGDEDLTWESIQRDFAPGPIGCVVADGAGRSNEIWTSLRQYAPDLVEAAEVIGLAGSADAGPRPRRRVELPPTAARLISSLGDDRTEDGSAVDTPAGTAAPLDAEISNSPVALLISNPVDVEHTVMGQPDLAIIAVAPGVDSLVKRLLDGEHHEVAGAIDVAGRRHLVLLRADDDRTFTIGDLAHRSEVDADRGPLV